MRTKILKALSNALRENAKKMASSEISEKKKPTTNQALLKNANAKPQESVQEKEVNFKALQTKSSAFVFYNNVVGKYKKSAFFLL